MIGVIHDSSIVLLVALLLSGCLCGISLISMVINANPLTMMIALVVTSIMTFVIYYMVGDVSMMSFQLLVLMFLGFIVLMLTSSRILIFLR